MYFYKTRRLVWSGLCYSEALESQCRSVVGHLAVKIKVPLAEKRGGCVMGDAGPWTRDWAGLTRSRAGGIREEARWVDCASWIYKYMYVDARYVYEAVCVTYTD